MNYLIRIAIAIITLSIIGSVIITHSDEDIRTKILSSFKNTSKKQQFKIFHFLFEKNYEINSEEGIKRYRIFKSNLKFIESQNLKQNSYTLGITEFTDLTADEFRKTYLSSFSSEKDFFSSNKFLDRKNDEIQNSQIYSYNEDSDEVLLRKKLNHELTPITQAKIDWTPFLGPAKNQGVCGSCWAFAAVGAIEGNYGLKFQTSPSFSQQQLVDCAFAGRGCRGGNAEHALYYIKRTGIAYDNDYPYTFGKTPADPNCVASSKIMNYILEDVEVCPYNECSKTQHRSLLSQGPITVSMDGDGNTNGSSIFQHYKEGILDMPCSQSNHAVLLVGVNTDSLGEIYTGRNSWGSTWGENGNFRFRARESDKTCFMENWGVLPKVKQTFNPVPPPFIFPCLRFYDQCGMKGKSFEVCTNNYDLDFPMAGFEIGKFDEIILFYKRGFCTGNYFQQFNRSLTCFQSDGFDNFTNNITSIIVDIPKPPKGCIWFYNDHCLKGKKIQICNDVADLNVDPYNFGNEISSFISGPNVSKVFGYANKNFENEIMNEKNVYGMHNENMNKKIQSLKIIKD